MDSWNRAPCGQNYWHDAEFAEPSGKRGRASQRPRTYLSMRRNLQRSSSSNIVTGRTASLASEMGPGLPFPFRENRMISVIPIFLCACREHKLRAVLLLAGTILAITVQSRIPKNGLKKHTNNRGPTININIRSRIAQFLPLSHLCIRIHFSPFR